MIFPSLPHSFGGFMQAQVDFFVSSGWRSSRTKMALAHSVF
jgi:hypothetical protein